MTDTSSTSAPLIVTERAAQRILEIGAAEALTAPALRVAVEGGGCSGFQYKFDIVGASEPDDIVLEKSGARVLVDPVSMEYMKGSQVDFVDDLIGSAFRITNPQAASSCGCGVSFSL